MDQNNLTALASSFVRVYAVSLAFLLTLVVISTVTGGCFPVDVDDELTGRRATSETREPPLAAVDGQFVYNEALKPEVWMPDADNCALSISNDSTLVIGRFAGMPNDFGQTEWAGGDIGDALSVAIVSTGDEMDYTFVIDLPLRAGDDSSSLFHSDQLSESQARGILSNFGQTSAWGDVDGATDVERSAMQVYSTPHGAQAGPPVSPFSFAAYNELCLNCFDSQVTTAAIENNLYAFTLSFAAVDVPVGNGAIAPSGNVLSGKVTYFAPREACDNAGN